MVFLLYEHIPMYDHISYITHNTYVTSHMEKRPGTGSLHPCAMSWGQAAHSPEGLGGWPLLDWGLCSPGVSWWLWGRMFPVDHRGRLIFFLAHVGHSAGWCDSGLTRWSQGNILGPGT